jgi:hypothetical protein
MKYKLIKEYPGSPAIGAIVNISYKNSNEDMIFNCQEYPEYWEEVVEPSYIVLSSKQNNVIKSIKRTSDNTVFTIGDKVTNGIIKRIDLRTQRYSCSDVDGWKFLDHCVKVKPLFTTEDRINVYEGDNYWCVNTAPHLFSLFEQTAKERTKLNKGVLAFNDRNKAVDYINKNKPLFITKDGVYIHIGETYWIYDSSMREDNSVFMVFNASQTTNGKGLHRTYFSTKEKAKAFAEDYSLLRRPYLSIKEVFDTLYLNIDMSKQQEYSFMKKLKDLVKSK